MNHHEGTKDAFLRGLRALMREKEKESASALIYAGGLAFSDGCKKNEKDGKYFVFPRDKPSKQPR